MKFLRKRELLQRTPTEQDADVSVDGVLLVGEEWVLNFCANESQYGVDDCLLYPAFHKGEKCWLIYRSWNAASGYCASGSEEEIINYQKGIDLLVDYNFFSSHHEK